MKNLDLSGYNPKFNIDSMVNFRTTIGGLISIFYLVFFLILFYLFGRDSLEKKFPTGYSQIIPYNISDLDFFTDLKDNKFIAGFGLLDRTGASYDNITDYLFPIFKYKLYKWDNESGTIKRSIQVLPTIKCNYSNSDLHENNKIQNLENYFCPNLKQVENDTIGGDFTFPYYSVINFEFSLCNSDRSKCNNITKTVDFINNNLIYMSVLYPTVQYSMNNYKKPFSSRIGNKYTFLQSLVSLKDYMYLRKNELENDTGNFYSSKNTITGLGKDRIESITLTKFPPNQEEVEKNGYFFYYCNIHYDIKKKFYSRWYQKIPDVLAQVLGVMKITQEIIKFFYFYYNKFVYDKFLFNRLIIVDEDESNDKSIKNIKSNSIPNMSFKRSSIKNEQINDDSINRKDELSSLSLIKRNSNNRKDQSSDNNVANSRDQNMINSSCDVMKINFSNLNMSESNQNERSKFNLNNSYLNNEIQTVRIRRNNDEKINKINNSSLNKIEEKNESNQINNNQRSKIESYEENNNDYLERERDDHSKNEDLNNSNLDKKSEKQDIETTDIIKNISKKFSEKSNKLQIPFFLYAMNNRRKNRYIDIFNYFKKKFDEIMDIFNFFKIEKNIEIFRKLLLNDYQNDLFGLLSEKYYYLNKENKEFLNKRSQQIIQRDQKIHDYLIESNSREKCEIENRLIDLFYKKNC